MRKGHPNYHIAVYLPGPCPIYTLGAIEAPFLNANECLGVEKYRFTYVGQSDPTCHHDDARPTGMVDRPCDQPFLDDFDCDLLIIASHAVPEHPLPNAEKQKIQQLFQRHLPIVAAFAGPFWLAESGLLGDQPVAIHWSLMDRFSERYPTLMISDHLYAQKHSLITTVGQSALVDCLVDLLEQLEGKEIAYAVSDLLCMDRIRPADERQRLPFKQFGGDVQPRLTMAVELMESNIEEPLSTEEIARLVHISRRQLERLFKRYLDTMPARYYLQLRLKKARQLLLTTNTSIVQIGLRCGFSSGPHFSSAYKSYYQLTPREERSKIFHQ